MRILKIVFGTVAVLALVLVGVALLLPPQVTVERQVLVQAPPEKVYPLVAAPRAWKDWSVWNRRDPQMQVRYSGPEAGQGAAWAWTSASEGNGEMRFTAAEAPRRVAYELRFEDWDSVSAGELRLAPEGGGTRVAWTMTANLGRNPVMRWMGLAMDRMVGPDFEAGLANLKALAEKP